MTRVGAKVNWDFRTSDLVIKPWWNWCLTPVANFGSPEGPVSQIHSPHLLVGAPGIFFRSFKVSSDAKERVGCRKQWEATAPIRSLVKLQPSFLSLQWKTCLRQNCSLGFSACSEGPAFGQNTLMMIRVYEKCHSACKSASIVIVITLKNSWKSSLSLPISGGHKGGIRGIYPLPKFWEKQETKIIRY